MEFREGLKGYTGETTNISSLININGYYVIKENTTMYFGFKGERIDTFCYMYYMFFEDGIYLDNFSLRSINEPSTSGFYKYARWGRYTISGDTIKTKWVAVNTPLNGPPYGSERWWIVIDRITIKEILSKPIKNMTSEEAHTYKEGSSASFVPLDTLPNPDYCWLKQEKWFWDNKEDWKRYMDSLKMEKRKEKNSKL